MGCGGSRERAAFREPHISCQSAELASRITQRSREKELEERGPPRCEKCGQSVDLGEGCPALWGS